jgi:hypothetical protein
MTTDRDIRQDYENQVATRLHEWASQIETLRHEAQGFPLDYRSHHLLQVEKLQGQLEMAEMQFQELKIAKTEAWDGLRDGMDEVLERLQNDLERTKFGMDHAEKFQSQR